MDIYDMGLRDTPLRPLPRPTDNRRLKVSAASGLMPFVAVAPLALVLAEGDTFYSVAHWERAGRHRS